MEWSLKTEEMGRGLEVSIELLYLHSNFLTAEWELKES